MSDCRLPRGIVIPTPLPTLTELFSTASDAGTYSYSAANSYEASEVQWSLGNITHTGICYGFGFTDGYLGIWKVDPTKSSASTKWFQTPIIQTNANQCGVVNYNKLYKGGFVASGTASTYYGAATGFLKFGYGSEIVDAVLGGMTATRLAGRNSASNNSLQTNDKTNEIYLCNASTAIEWWTTNGSTWTRLGNAYGTAYQVSNGYLSTTNNSYYGGSIIGLK